MLAGCGGCGGADGREGGVPVGLITSLFSVSVVLSSVI